MRRRGVVNLKELVRFEIEGRSVTLPAHKRILSYDISLEPLPRTTTGKIKRHEVERRLRAQAAGAEAVTLINTMLGMVIGVAAVVAMMAIGQGAQATVNQNVDPWPTALRSPISPPIRAASFLEMANPRPVPP